MQIKGRFLISLLRRGLSWLLAKSRLVCCDAQEKLETRQGQRQGCAQEGRKAHDAEKSKVQGPAFGQRWSETRGQEKATTEERGKKNAKTSDCAVEDTIIDAIEEPVPGVV